jgi:2-polyprenyl-3-methyl-5-hydroxy-6-metoxy-1,4-benzoquinol methylase
VSEASRVAPGHRYFDGSRSDLLDWLGGRYARVLEIGCGRGGNAVWFRQHGASWITGIDLDGPSAQQAATRFDSVLVGDVGDLLDEIDDRFDLIVCADVLEHLHDPWTVVSRLRELATPGGTIVASIPNVRFYRALWKIAVGQGFWYEPEGIFDRTHLRFFTGATIRDLIHQGGWSVRRLEPSPSRRRHLRTVVEIMTARRSREWLTYQWFVEGRATDDVTATRS